MTKFEMPKILKPLALANYAPEFGDATILVWVNPPRKKLEELMEMLREVVESFQNLTEISKDKPPDPDAVEKAAERTRASSDKVMAWYAEDWSQGPEETRWSFEEVKELVDHSSETDPALWKWLTDQTQSLIVEHRASRKKV